MKQSEKPLHDIAVASDHAGIELKSFVTELLKKDGHSVIDLGPTQADSVDYPDYAFRLCQEILGGSCSRGILICGTGLGMSMAANRFRGIRAALCTSHYMARLARCHNDANVLCLGARVLGLGEIQDIVSAFFNQKFDAGRHTLRIAKLDTVGESN